MKIAKQNDQNIEKIIISGQAIYLMLSKKFKLDFKRFINKPNLFYELEIWILLECSTISFNLHKDGCRRNNISGKGRRTGPRLFYYFLESCIIQ